MKLSVVGLGKLGACTAACFAAKGYEVVGVDINADFVAAVNAGKAPVYEPRLDELIQASKGRFTATQDLQSIVYDTDITFLIVPTPSQEDGHFSDAYLQKALRPLAQALSTKENFHTFVITSTVSPGTIDQRLIPLLEKESGKKINQDFGLAYNPEFIALGSVITDFLTADMVLIGESCSQVGEQLQSIYETVCESNPYIARMSLVSAEIAKISVNSYVTTKISFANTLASLCEEIDGAEVDQITAALGADKRIAPHYLKGGLGYGGPCFPRDNRAFAAFAATYGIDAKIAKATDGINEVQNQRLCEHIASICDAKNIKSVVILGLSYKPYTPVIEESPAIKLISLLIKKGIKVVAYDPLAMDATRDMFADKIEYAESFNAAVNASNFYLLMTRDPMWQQLESAVLPHEHAVIVDSWRQVNESSLDTRVEYIKLGAYHSLFNSYQKESSVTAA